MSLPTQKPIFYPAPSEYDADYFNSILGELENFVERLNTIGPVTATTMRITDLPTSASGLPSGYLWNDSGTVKVA